MSQSEKVAVMLIVGYVIFTTLRGNLITWLQILGFKS